MKSLIFILSLLSVSAQALPRFIQHNEIHLFDVSKLVKVCSTNMKDLDTNAPIEQRYEIYSNAEKLTADIWTKRDGIESIYSEPVEFSDHSVRPNLTAQYDENDLNFAEELVVHAMTVTTDPIFEGTFSAGLDLAQIRYAKLFLIGKASNMGSTTLVEAYDIEYKTLGTFLGGFVVLPCKLIG